jgi:hypothetical protein
MQDYWPLFRACARGGGNLQALLLLQAGANIMAVTKVSSLINLMMQTMLKNSQDFM